MKFLIEPTKPIEIQRLDKMPHIRLNLVEGERVRITYMPDDGYCPASKLFFDKKAKV